MERRTRPMSAVVFLLVLAGGPAALVWSAVETTRVVRHSGVPSTFDGILGLGALLGALLAGAWLIVGLGVASLAAFAGVTGGALNRFAERVAPPVIRRLARVAAGVTVVTSGLSLPANGAVAQVAPVPLPDLDRPVAVVSRTSAEPSAPTLTPPSVTPPEAAATSSSPTTPQRPAGQETVIVERGDTLWCIAATRLGPDPTNAEIAQTWPRWYAANRAVIGADPDLIFPGQRLQPPD